MAFEHPIVLSGVARIRLIRNQTERRHHSHT
jgi:hypothetical protein